MDRIRNSIHSTGSVYFPIPEVDGNNLKQEEKNMTKKISKKAEQARKNLETGLIMMESEARNIEDFLSRMIPFLHNKEFRQKMTQYMYSYVVDKRSQSLRKRYFKDTFSTAPIKSEEKK